MSEALQTVFANLVDTLLYKLYHFQSRKEVHSSGSKIKVCLSISSTTIRESQAHRRLDCRICVAGKTGFWRDSQNAFSGKNPRRETWKGFDYTVTKLMMATKLTTSFCRMYSMKIENSTISLVWDSILLAKRFQANIGEKPWETGHVTWLATCTWPLHTGWDYELKEEHCFRSQPCISWPGKLDAASWHCFLQSFISRHVLPKREKMRRHGGGREPRKQKQRRRAVGENAFIPKTIYSAGSHF